MATSIDNPFAIARNRSEKAGRVLADALINRAQGERPVTLIGYSLGSRVIYSCLKSLAERQAFGLVENVIFIGSPIPSNTNNWRVMRSVVSGKMFNIYSENDYILAFLYRATSIQFGVAGLQKIGDVEGIENMDLSKEVSGHLRYPELIGKILKRTGIEHVLVEDSQIESDSTEIQLLDIENPVEQKNTKNSHQADLLDLMDAPISELEGDNGMNDLTRGIGSLEMSVPEKSLHTFSFNSQPLRPDGSHRSMSDPSSEMGHAAPPGLQSRSTETDIMNFSMGSNTAQETTQSLNADMLNITQSLNSIHVSDPPSYSRNPAPKQHPSQYDSDSDDGGIQMINNDSDDEDLTYVPGVPMPDDWNPEPRDAGKVPAFEEQKSLGSFPRDRGSGNQNPRTSGPSGSETGEDKRRGNGNGNGRVSADQFGLY